jgi:chromosome segregation ATPase
MNSSSKKSSVHSSKHMKSNSSVGMKEDNTVDSEILKNNLHEFYRNSKEKLTHFRDEIQVIDNENQKQKDENNEVNLRSIELQRYNEELGLRLKGMKEKLIAAQKHKTSLQNGIREKRRDIEVTSRNIETLKIDNNYKIQIIQNDIEHHHVVKENNVKSIKKKIESEEAYQANLMEKMNEIKEEIARYKNLIRELDQHDSERSKVLNKETSEMTKFLAEL